MIPKKILKSGSFELSFLKFENKKCYQSKETLKMNWNDQRNSDLPLSKIINFGIKNSAPDSLLKPKLFEAYYNGEKHEIIVELDPKQKGNTNYLQFSDTVSPSTFQIEISILKHPTNTNLAKAIFSQYEAKTFLNNRGRLFKLSLISKKGNEEFKVYPLKSLYYLKFY
jgi:hypothetical protein